MFSFCCTTLLFHLILLGRLSCTCAAHHYVHFWKIKIITVRTDHWNPEANVQAVLSVWDWHISFPCPLWRRFMIELLSNPWRKGRHSGCSDSERQLMLQSTVEYGRNRILSINKILHCKPEQHWPMCLLWKIFSVFFVIFFLFFLRHD